MIEPHIDATELRKKIIELFEYRMFPQLFDIQINRDKNNDSELLSKLIDLQTSIYHLDAHLEANWKTDENILNWHWQQISMCLSKFGALTEDIDNYVAHIKKYQYHELSLRTGKNLLAYNLEYFYFYKSCDVKLMRRLIYEQYGLKKKIGSLSAWRYFDLVTEVNDDVTDLFEDLDFINGNLVLISIIKDGKEATINRFSDFLDVILAQSKITDEVYKSLPFASIIYAKTLEQVEQTKALLISNVADINVEKSILNQRMLEGEKVL